MADEMDPLEARRWEITRRLSAFADEIADAAGLANAADGALVALTARALAEDLWAGWRIHTPQQWLTMKMGVSKHTAAKIVRVARRAADLPVTLDHLRQGRISLDQATVIARYVPADYEASACEAATKATVQQLSRALGRYGYDQDQIDRDTNADTHRKPRGPRREVTFGSRSSDEWSLRAVLPADEGAVIEDVLKDTCDRLHTAARDRAKAQADAQGRSTKGTDAELHVDQPSWADALVSAMKVVATTNSDGEQVAGRVGCLIHLEHPDADDPDQGRWKATLHRGPRLPGHLRRLLTCDCDVSIIWRKDGTPVQAGRSKRLVSRSLRRLIEKRDVSCRVPGCTRHVGLQIPSHQPPPSALHWEDDGETVTWNLLLLCGHHHRLHHQGWLGSAGNADANDGPDMVRFTFATGHLISPAPVVLSPAESDAPPLDHQPFPGATGENVDIRWFHLNRLVDGVDLTRALAHQPGTPPSPQP